VLASTVASLDIVKFPVEIWILPPLPSAVDPTKLLIPLKPTPWGLIPSIVILSVASILMFPALPMPEVLASMLPPLVRESLFVVISISPALPSAVGRTELLIPLKFPH
jgi:hypothetical protein